jgi:hypothetical protein
MSLKRWLLVVVLTAAAGCGRRTVDVIEADEPPPGEQPVVRAQDEEPKPAPRSDPKPADEPVPFRFPDDRGGKLAARLLAPPETLPAERTTTPKGRKATPAVESPLPPLPPQVASLSRLPERTDRPVHRLPLLTPEPPPGADEGLSGLPQVQPLQAGERLRVPSADVAAPPGLPVLAQPLSDRAPVTDPTADASRSAALTAPLPDRTAPAPYLRLGLPDPFEFHDAVRPPPLGDEPAPNLAPSRKP